MKNLKLNFYFVLLVSTFISFGFTLYQYKDLKGKFFLENNEKVEVQVLSRHSLLISENCPSNIRNFLETMWVTGIGRKSVIHLLKSRSKIYINVTDSIGAFRYFGDVDFMYAMTGAVSVNGRKKTISEYNDKPTWEAIELLICKGTFHYSHYDTTLFNQNKILIMDYDNGNRLTGASRDSAIQKLKKIHFHNDSIRKNLLRKKTYSSELEETVNPKGKAFIYKTCREFYFLTGLHEITHTTTKNIYLSRKLLDAESPAFKAEKKGKRRLRKVLRSKTLKYNECD